MPRIRTIKPDAFLSESLSSVPRGTRWTFAGLWTFADDKGRARDDARLIKAALYPLDDEVGLDEVTHDLALLAGIGSICRYEVDGRAYLHMVEWAGHQKINRPTPVKSPPCPDHEDGMSGHVLPAEPSQTTHGGLTEPSGWEGKGKEGKGKGRETPGLPPADDDAPAPTARPDVERICERLATLIESNGSKRPTITKAWRDAARLMLDKDGRVEGDVLGAIAWSQADEFWRSNILSLPKLREKYDTLRLQAERKAAGGGNRADRTNGILDRAMARAEAREAGA